MGQAKSHPSSTHLGSIELALHAGLSLVQTISHYSGRWAIIVFSLTYFGHGLGLFDSRKIPKQGVEWRKNFILKG